MDDVTFLASKLAALQHGGPQPTKAYMIEVGIDRNGKKVLIGYTQYWKSPAFTPTTAHTEFLAWTNALIANPKKGDPLTKHNKPGKRKMTKLSFRCNELVYLVFKLDDKIDWRFSVDGPPVSSDSDLNSKGVFFAPKGSGELTDSRTYAYVVADCPKGSLGSTIEAYFNLHVDFLEGGEADAYTPVIIDPDVRYPGGHGDP